MILPQGYIGTLIVLIFSLLCLGLWANTYKAGSKLRFELYSIDFAIGLGLAAFIFAFTFGNMGFDGFSLMDDMAQSHKKQWLDAIGAGVSFNLANMFLLAAVSVSGMAVAFPVALGLALVVGVLAGQLGQRAAGPLYLVGCVAIVAAIVVGALAQSSLIATRPRAGKGRRPGAAKPLILAIASGLLLSLSQYLSHNARTGEISLGPYSSIFLFGAGAFISTFVFSLFFMNLPVHGEALEIMDYFKTTARNHLYGLVGGILFCAGLAGTFAAASTIPEARVGRAASIALSNGGPVIAALCGLLIWKEFQEGSGRAKGLAFLETVLFAAGLAVLSMSFA